MDMVLLRMFMCRETRKWTISFMGQNHGVEAAKPFPLFMIEEEHVANEDAAKKEALAKGKQEVEKSPNPRDVSKEKGEQEKEKEEKEILPQHLAGPSCEGLEWKRSHFLDRPICG